MARISSIQKVLGQSHIEYLIDLETTIRKELKDVLM